MFAYMYVRRYERVNEGMYVCVCMYVCLRRTGFRPEPPGLPRPVAGARLGPPTKPSTSLGARCCSRSSLSG